MWQQILDYHLSGLKLKTKYLFEVGHKDLKIISEQLLDRSTFWSHTLREISQIAMEIENTTDTMSSLARNNWIVIYILNLVLDNNWKHIASMNSQK